MARRKLLALAAVVGTGFGCTGLAGFALGQYVAFRRAENEKWTNALLDFQLPSPASLHIPSVEAATMEPPMIPQLPAKTKSLDVVDSPGTYGRVSEIMKFGFPSLENVRSFDDFVLSYDRRNRCANWVFEHLTPDNVRKNPETDRNNCSFQEDNSIHPYFRATNTDFRGSGYDRGHLAAAANHRQSHSTMEQTFQLSNIAPQVGKGFNRDAWNNLEMFTRGIARKNKNTYVCTGPLYLPRREADGRLYVKYEVIGKNNVAVPTHFFKVIVVEDHNGYFDLLSFVMANEVLPDNVDLKFYQVPIESIERAAGFLLFDKIPRNRFRRINGLK